MKKINTIIFIFLFSLILVGCTNSNSDKDSYLVELSFEELQEKLDNKDTFFFEIVQDDCTYCQAFTPKLKEVLTQYKITGYSINMSDMSEEEYKQFQEKFKTSGTPNTIFITAGEEISEMQRISGNVAKSKIIAKLKSNGYIKE